jgi:hypothetical protein
MKRREDLYSQVKNLRLLCGTWNLAGVEPPKLDNPDISLASWLHPFKQEFSADIVVLGFQEIVELNAK